MAGNYYTPVAGTKTIASAGTAGALTSTAKTCRQVTIQALRTNAGLVTIGASDVTHAGKNGISLAASGTYTIVCPDQDRRVDLSQIFVDVATNNDGVAFFYF